MVDPFLGDKTNFILMKKCKTAFFWKQEETILAWILENPFFHSYKNPHRKII